MDPFALRMGLLCPWSRRSKGPKVYMTERRCPAHCALDLMGIERGVWSRHVGDDDDDSADRGDSDGMTITMQDPSGPRSTATFATVTRNFGRKGDRQSGSLRGEGVSAPKDARLRRLWMAHLL